MKINNFKKQPISSMFSHQRNDLQNSSTQTIHHEIWNPHRKKKIEHVKFNIKHIFGLYLHNIYLCNNYKRILRNT